MTDRLYFKGDLVISSLDLELRIYRVKSATWKDGDWTYHFYPTGQGGRTEKPIRQQFLQKVDIEGNLI